MTAPTEAAVPDAKTGNMVHPGTEMVFLLKRHKPFLAFPRKCFTKLSSHVTLRTRVGFFDVLLLLQNVLKHWVRRTHLDSSDKDLDTDIDSETKPVDVNGTGWEPGAANSSLSEVKEAPDARGRTAPAPGRFPGLSRFLQGSPCWKPAARGSSSLFSKWTKP